MRWKRPEPMQNVVVSPLSVPDAVLARARRAARDVCDAAAELDE